MRQRRDPFARVTYVPKRTAKVQSGVLAPCTECGTQNLRIYYVEAQSDGGRVSALKGQFCSWSCAEAYHGQTIGR